MTNTKARSLNMVTEAVALEDRDTAAPRLAIASRRALVANSCIGLLVLALVVAVTWLYVSSESTFYSSDYAGYQTIAQDMANRWSTSPRSALGALWRSMSDEYNAIFTIPIVPFLLVFGEARLAYELALAIVYLFPFVLVVGGISAELFPQRSSIAFWCGVLAVLLIPATWVPTLRGYPDAAAALLVSVAAWAYLRDTTLASRWQIAVVGAAAASSMLLRRHFAYAAIALFAAMSLHALGRSLMSWSGGPRVAARRLYQSALRVGAAGIVAALVLVGIGFPFVYRGLTTNYIGLYAAYMLPAADVFEWYARAFGAIVLAGAAAGILAAVLCSVVDRDRVAFVTILGGVLLLEWVFIVRQPGPQYTMQFTPVVAAGLAALIGTLHVRLNGARRLAALCALVLVLGANVAGSLSGRSLVPGSFGRVLFAMTEAPFRREDRPEIARLVSYLRTTALQRRPIYVAASSGILTTSLLTTAERAVYGSRAAQLRMLYAPQVDSRDFYPLELLVQAEYVVVADPVQQHLGIDQQRVVKVVHDLFLGTNAIANDFAREPETFRLMNDTVVTVYRRVRPTDMATALDTLRIMEAEVKRRPGGQLDWMLMDAAYPSTVRRDGGGYRILLRLRSGEPAQGAVLHLGPLPERMTVTGTIAQQASACPEMTLHLATVNASGAVIHGSEAPLRPEAQGGFAVDLAGDGASNLLLTARSVDGHSAASDCSLDIRHLQVSPR